jgi:hypothetical protein
LVLEVVDTELEAQQMVLTQYLAQLHLLAVETEARALVVLEVEMVVELQAKDLTAQPLAVAAAVEQEAQAVIAPVESGFQIT